jgi:hypothetical protein
MSENALLNVAQVQKRLGDCSRSWVYQLVQEDKLKGILLGERKGLRIYSVSLEKYIKEKKRGRAA